MKRNFISFDDFIPDVEEDYTGVPYVVEDDKALQPAVALQQMLKTYGPTRVFSGYTSDVYSDDIPVTEYRPDLQTFAERVRESQEELEKSALNEADGNEQSDSVQNGVNESEDVLASEQANSNTSSEVVK